MTLPQDERAAMKEVRRPEEHLEIERRWLVKLPLSEHAEKMLKEEADVPTRITQTYLVNHNGARDAIRRVRCVEPEIWGVKQPAHYVETTKQFVELGINKESEHSLTGAEYQAILNERDPDTEPVVKTRYHIHHDGRLFELDEFHGTNEGLSILELECDSLAGEVALPKWLDVECEITKEHGWSNYDLACLSFRHRQLLTSIAPDTRSWANRIWTWALNKIEGT